MSSAFRLLQRCGFAFLMILAMTAIARADSFTIVSEAYRVAANGYGYNGCCHVNEVSYDETSSSPLSHSDDVIVSPGTEFMGAFFLKTHATGGITATSLFVQADRDQFDISFAIAVTADAYATMTFKPTESAYIFKTEDPFSPFSSSVLRASAELYDETAASTVLGFGPAVPTPAEYPVSLNPDHIYSIKASALGPFPAETGVRVSLTAVPETESVLTFLLFGLVAVGATRARNRWY